MITDSESQEMMAPAADPERSDQPLRLVFEGQARHLGLLATLITVTLWTAYAFDGFLDGEWLRLSTEAWVYGALALPVLHQVWVWLWWRLEYHLGWCSRTFGANAFRIYGFGFALLAFVRIFTVIALSIANRETAPIPTALAWTVSAVLMVPAAWLFYSVARYFGFSHALGADHFFEEHRHRPLCRDGIFRHVQNAMYTVGFFVLWIPAVGCASKAGLLLAAFNHAYIWVHYYSTEKPDMKRIYRS